MTISDLISKFISDIKPYLDDSFSTIIVDFDVNDKHYQLAITDDSDFDEMMDILRNAYQKRYDNMSDEEKRKYN